MKNQVSRLQKLLGQIVEVENGIDEALIIKTKPDLRLLKEMIIGQIYVEKAVLEIEPIELNKSILD